MKSFSFLAIFVVTLLTLLGCDDNNNNNSGNTFSENQFVADSGLKANPQTDLIVKFLEPPAQNTSATTNNDSGEIGFDEIPFTYDTAIEHTYCWEDDAEETGHIMTLEDIEGQVILSVVSNGDCVTATVPPGDYIFKTIHDGFSDKTHVIFVIPNPDELQASLNSNGVFKKAKSFVLRAFNLITNKTVKDAHAQTSPLQTLISTRACIGCDLRGVDLSFRDLEGVDLTGANLKNATMQGSDVDIAELTSARLIGTNLTDATFINSDFTVASVDETTIFKGARFANATWLDGQCMCEVFNPTPLDSLTAGNGPISVSHHPVTDAIYIANVDGNTLSVINPITNMMLTDPIDVGPGPRDVVISSDGSLLYVVNSNEDPLGMSMGNVAVVNTSTNQVTTTIPAGVNPSSAAVSPDGKTLYVANSDNQVLIIDTILNVVTGSIDGLTASFLAITPDGSKLYVTNLISSEVSVIDTSTNTITKTITVGEGPAEAAVSVNNILYVANNRDNTLSIIDTLTDNVITTINVGLRPTALNISPDGSFIFVANQVSNSVVVIDGFKNEVIGQIALEPQALPNSVAVSPDATRVYVANRGTDNVSVIELLSVGECSGCM